MPNIGESPMMTEANADLTCWFASETSSLTHGRIFVMIKLSRTSGARYWQKSGGRKKKIQLKANSKLRKPLKSTVKGKYRNKYNYIKTINILKYQEDKFH